MKLYNYLVWCSIIAMYIFFITTPVSATTETFRQNLAVNYSKQCINNGTACSGSAMCNITIQYPDNNFVVRNTSMTNLQNGWFRYNINAYLLSSLGTYTVNINCIDNSAYGAETYYFEVTPTGNTDTTNFYWIILGVGFIIIMLGFWIDEPYLVIFGSIIMFLIGLSFLIYGFGGEKNNTTYAVSIIIIGFAAFLSIESARQTIVE